MKFLNIKSTLLLVVTVLFSSALLAQDYSFMVLGEKGDNKVDGNDLKVGAQLKSAQSITVGSGAYLGLAHSSGKTLEIKKAGDYTVKALEAQLAKLNDNTTGQIAMFIIDELTSDDNKSNRFSSSVVKTGSVQRATSGSSPLQVMLPAQSEFLPGKVTIKWYVDGDIDAPQKYTFIARNLKSEEVIKKEVTGESVELDLSELNAFDSKLLKYQIISEDLKSEEYGLKLPRSSKEVESVEAELAKLPEGDSSINHFLRAEFFAKKGMLANAINSYEAAGDAFSESYEEFLTAFQLTKEAKEAAKKKKADNSAGE